MESRNRTYVESTAALLKSFIGNNKVKQVYDFLNGKQSNVSGAELSRMAHELDKELKLNQFSALQAVSIMLEADPVHNFSTSMVVMAALLNVTVSLIAYNESNDFIIQKKLNSTFNNAKNFVCTTWKKATEENLPEGIAKPTLGPYCHR